MLTFEYYNLRTMDLTPTGGALGVEVRNVDTSRPLEEPVWRPGDLVIWDNRCTMHRREPFDVNPRRILKRAQMFGDKPYLEV